MPEIHVVTGYAGAVARLIGAHKERANPAARAALAEALARSVWSAAAAAMAGGPEQSSTRDPVPPHARPCTVVAVPAPSSSASRRRRGEDPTELLAHAAVRRLVELGVPAVLVPALRAQRPVRDQAGLAATARATNVAGSMALGARGRSAVLSAVRSGAVLIVVDDVVTTGVTLSEAVRALEHAGVRAHGVATVAATLRRGRTGGPDPPDLLA
ncbi:MAG: phosphoribosyltransferase family protein [Actinomycetes bacterium]